MKHRTIKHLTNASITHVRENQSRRIRVAKILVLDPFEPQIKAMQQSRVFKLAPVEDAYVKFFERLLSETTSLIANRIDLHERNLDRRTIRAIAEHLFDVFADELQSMTQAYFDNLVTTQLLITHGANQAQLKTLLKKHDEQLSLRMATARGWLRDELDLRLQKDLRARESTMASSTATKAAIVSVLVAIVGTNFAYGAWRAADKQAVYAADQTQLAKDQLTLSKCTSELSKSTEVVPAVKCPIVGQGNAPQGSAVIGHAPTVDVVDTSFTTPWCYAGSILLEPDVSTSAAMLRSLWTPTH